MQTVLMVAEMNAKTLETMLADVPADAMCRQPNGVRNHAAWQVGHLAFVRSGMAQILGAEPVVGPEWQALFGKGTEPTDDPSRYPAKEELLATFRKAHQVAMDALKRVDEATLDQPTPIPSMARRFPTKRILLAGMFGTHDGLHLGQLSVWRRLMGLPRVL